MLVCLGLYGPTGKSFAADIQVQAAVESQDVFVGESINFQIQVQGHDSPPEPDISQIKNFRVQFRGGQQNSSTSISYVNGKMHKVTNRAYIFNYLITPLKTGRLTFPAIILNIDGHSYQTRPFAINAHKPVESENFKLRQQLSKDHCYVGEPLILTTTWYIGKDVKNFEFNLPLLDDPRFTVYSRKPDKLPASRDDQFEIPIGSQKYTAIRGSGSIADKSFTTLTIQQTVVPRRSGDFSLPQATVSCKALSGYSQRRSRGFGAFEDDPFAGSFFGNSRQKVYRTEVVPANEPRLKVIPLPGEGKPDNFSGLIGSYKITCQANPTDVNVGDPITLTIKVSGPFVDNVKPPSLAGLAARGFKVPEEMASGTIDGGNKIFTQTIRAREKDIQEIPAINLSFFNSATGSYETSSSRPIAISVHPTRIITALDGEGAAEKTVKKQIKSTTGGINFNYDGAEVLSNQEQAKISPDLIILILAGPPGCFFLLLGLTLFQRRNRDSEKSRAKKAAAEFNRKLDRLGDNGGPAELARALKIYLGLKLSRPSAALTFLDIEPRLQSANVSPDTLEGLRLILEEGEAAQYAGGTEHPETMEKSLERARQLIAELEKRLG